MKTVKLSKNSFWFKYWEFITLEGDTWERKLPKDTCSLRRDLIVFTIFAILAFPFVVLARLLMGTGIVEKGTLGKFYYIPALMGQFLAIGIGSGIFPKGDLLLWYLSGLGAVLLGVIALAVVLFITILAAISIGKIVSKRKRIREEKRIISGVPKQESIIKVLWHGLLDKVCSRLEYTE